MTKEITKARIVQELSDKFRLRELEPEVFSLSERVVPVYDIEQHLEHPSVKVSEVSITSADAFYFFPVPKEERWHIHGYNVIFKTGSYTVAGVMVLRPLNVNWFYLDLKAAQNVSYAVNLPKDVVVKNPEYISINVDGYTSTGNLELRLDVTVEEIR